MAHARTLSARRDVPITRDAFRSAMELFAASGVALLVGLWIVAQVLSAGEQGVATQLLSTAALIDEHAAAMTDHGERLLAAATAGTGADRAHWLGDARHMIADGATLQALATRLRTTASELGDRPEQFTNASGAMLDARAAALRADGASTIAHGHMMVDHAVLMSDLARQPGSAVTIADAQLMSGDAARIIDAGERVLHVAGSLGARADQLRGALRR
jgi:hypothetical protein